MSKKLVAYFSATGITKKAALKIAELADADVFEIKPEVPYTEADLNWRDGNSRSSVEMKDKEFRPPIAEKLPNANKYDVMFVCFPIWWYVAPTIINTFLESCDLRGKTVILCATSGSSDFGRTLEELENSCIGAILTEGRMLNGELDETDETEIKRWLKSLNI